MSKFYLIQAKRCGQSKTYDGLGVLNSLQNNHRYKWINQDIIYVANDCLYFITKDECNWRKLVLTDKIEEKIKAKKKNKNNNTSGALL